MRKITNMLAVPPVAVLIFAVCILSITAKDEELKNPGIAEKLNAMLPATTYEPIECVVINDITEKSPAEEEQIPYEDVELIALVTMAEAEGECEKGKRLVIDTILNRVDSEHFPDTIHDVIYQPNHFSVMWNGRIDRCEVTEEVCQLVIEELRCRTNYDVIFFTADGYSKYGVPIFQVGNHYFSSYN